MTGDEFNTLLAQLGWSTSILAFRQLRPGLGSCGSAVAVRQNKIPRLASAGCPNAAGPPRAEGLGVTARRAGHSL
jgi:hypothetical protein